MGSALSNMFFMPSLLEGTSAFHLAVLNLDCTLELPEEWLETLMQGHSQAN